MHTESRPTASPTDLAAVCEFLLSGREIPPSPKPPRKPGRVETQVPVRQGIARARLRSVAKA